MNPNDLLSTRLVNKQIVKVLAMVMMKSDDYIYVGELSYKREFKTLSLKTQEDIIDRILCV